MSLNQGYLYRSRVMAKDVGRTVIEYHTTRFPHASYEDWRERIESGDVRLNGSPVECERVVAEGDELEFFRPPWVEPEAPSDFRVVYEDDMLLVVDKPAGLQVLPAGLYLEHTLLRLVRSSRPSRADSSPIHRLGRGTSGLVLFGKQPAARASLASQFRSFQITKTYLAIVHGTRLRLPRSATHPIGPRPHGSLRIYCADPGGKPSRTRLRVLRKGKSQDTHLVAAQPITGRADQIRIHLAAAGAPLLGDPLFGVGGTPISDAPPGAGGYYLHAAALNVAHPTTGRRLKLRSLPVWA